MRIIVLDRRLKGARTLTIPTSVLWGVPLLAALCLAAALVAGYQLAVHRIGAMPADVVNGWQAEIGSLQQRTRALGEQSERDTHAYASRVATLQARLMRMEAVGQRLAAAANLKGGEFDFTQAPALGGPMTPVPVSAGSGAQLDQSILELTRLIDDRERQLGYLETLLSHRTLFDEVALAGKPVKNGYLSSRFGVRTDPFTGRQAMHKGLDFTAPFGAPVVAVASGIVVFAGWDAEYGKLVEIRHSDGYRSRYAHNSTLLVKPGDMVKKGQVISKVGRTGRASGVHLHFEVVHDGKLVDPMAYIGGSARRG